MSAVSGIYASARRTGAPDDVVLLVRRKIASALGAPTTSDRSTT